MCMSAKASISAWWIMVILSLFLWYRNINYDRVIAAFVFTLALIQLVEYGVQSGVNSEEGGKLIYIVLWLQVFVLGVGTYMYLHSGLAAVLATISTIIFAVALVYVLTTNSVFSVMTGPSGHLEWTQNGKGLLGNWGWLYLLGIIVPFILMLASSGWKDIGIYFLIGYGILSSVLVSIYFPGATFPSMWCYSAIGFAFVAWMIGIFQPSQSCQNIDNQKLC